MENDVKGVSLIRMRRKSKDSIDETTKTKNNRHRVEEEETRKNVGTNRKTTKTGPNQRKRSKKKQIYDAISDSNNVDIDLLRHLAITTGGLLSKRIRRKVWPILAGVDSNEKTAKPCYADITNHKDYQQVNIDVIRCLRRFPPYLDYDERMSLQDQLTNLIIRIFMKHPELHYYQLIHRLQRAISNLHKHFSNTIITVHTKEARSSLFFDGFHDICVTFLIEVGEELAFAIMDKLSVTILKKFMERTMDSTVDVLNCICPLIGKCSPRLLQQLDSSGIDTIFCLSWIITWFGHVLDEHSEIVRLYDVFLASDSLMPVYLAATLVLHRESEVLELERDMATVHHFLSNLPEHLPLESLVKRAVQLSEEYPPDRLVEDMKPTGRSFKMLLKSRNINKNDSKVSDKFDINIWRFSLDSVWLTLAIAASVGAITFGIHYVVTASNKVSVL